MKNLFNNEGNTEKEIIKDEIAELKVMDDLYVCICVCMCVCLNSVKLLHASRYCASNVEPCHTLPISLSPFRDHCATRPQQLWWMRCNSPLKLVVMLMSRLQVWPLHITNHRQQQAVSYVELILVLLKLFPESNRVPIFNN